MAERYITDLENSTKFQHTRERFEQSGWLQAREKHQTKNFHKNCNNVREKTKSGSAKIKHKNAGEKIINLNYHR